MTLFNPPPFTALWLVLYTQIVSPSIRLCQIKKILTLCEINTIAIGVLLNQNSVKAIYTSTIFKDLKHFQIKTDLEEYYLIRNI